MATVLKQLEQGTPVGLLTTELNSIGSNANTVAGTAVNNLAGGGTSNMDGYVRGKVELVLAAYTGTPAAGSAVYVWFLKTVDGTNYEDGSNTVTPARSPDVVIPVNATASGPQRVIQECWVPVGLFEPLARNAGTGITFASSGNTLKILLNTDEGV